MYIADTAIIQTLASSRLKSGILRRVSLSPQKTFVICAATYTCMYIPQHSIKSIRRATLKPCTRGLLGKSQFVHCTFSFSEN